MLSDRNIFCPLGGGEKQRGPMPLGRFLFNITQREFIQLQKAFSDLCMSPKP